MDLQQPLFYTIAPLETVLPLVEFHWSNPESIYQDLHPAMAFLRGVLSK